MTSLPSLSRRNRSPKCSLTTRELREERETRPSLRHVLQSTFPLYLNPAPLRSFSPIWDPSKSIAYMRPFWRRLVRGWIEWQGRSLKETCQALSARRTPLRAPRRPLAFGGFRPSRRQSKKAPRRALSSRLVRSSMSLLLLSRKAGGKPMQSFVIPRRCRLDRRQREDRHRSVSIDHRGRPRHEDDRLRHAANARVLGDRRGRQPRGGRQARRQSDAGI